MARRPPLRPKRTSLVSLLGLCRFSSTAPAFFGAFWRSWLEGGLPGVFPLAVARRGAGPEADCVFSPKGLIHVFCDSDMAAWGATTFPYFCYTFYLSKFFEVIDTAIILAKGKKVRLGGVLSYLSKRSWRLTLRCCD